MKKTIFAIGLLVVSFQSFSQVQYKVITAIESIVPMGLGRSRLIEHQEAGNLGALTTNRTSGGNSKQSSVRRKDAKIDNFTETKLLNFYSGVGINFQNIASNDALISAKLNEMSAQGWELFQVASGVESKGSSDDNNGIYITRYIFKK